MSHDPHSVNHLGSVDQRVGRPGDRRTAVLLKLLLSVLEFLLQRFDPSQQVLGRRLHRDGEFLDDRLGVSDLFECPGAGECRDPPYALGHRFFGDDAAEANLAGVREVSAATQFGAEFTHLHHSHIVGVLFAEQGHCSGLASVFQGHDLRRDRGTFGHTGIDFVFDATDLLGRHGLFVCEVEPKSVAFDLRAALHGVLAEHNVQRVMQQVCGRVGSANARPSLGVDTGGELVA